MPHSLLLALAVFLGPVSKMNYKIFDLLVRGFT
jgi:hypothetical protein